MTESSDWVADYAALLVADERLDVDPFYLKMGRCIIKVLTNRPKLSTDLKHYFSDYLTQETNSTFAVQAIERPELELDVEFRDWRREHGKSGRKDSYFDFDGGRLLRKVRTGMVFLQSEAFRIAAGPCLVNENQVINFINSQYMGWLQREGWITCHAAGVVKEGKALAMAGFSGGGKSSLMLRTMDYPEVNYLTNDRLLLKVEQQCLMAAGIAKLPRINPGTIVHNPRLHALIPEKRRRELLSLPVSELWDLEEKYDVIVNEVYGENRISDLAPLHAFVVLNWDRVSVEPVQVIPVDLNKRLDLLKAIMKSPGPFLQLSDGGFHSDTTPLNEKVYLDALKGVKVYEVTGKPDFDQVAKVCIDQILVED